MPITDDIRAEVDRIFGDRRFAQRSRIAEAIRILRTHGKLNRRHIMMLGEVSKPQATLDLRLIQERMPDLMTYDRSERCYLPAAERKEAAMPTLMFKHPSAGTLDLERALEIVGAINNRAFLTMGLAQASEVGSLEGASLAQMLEAKQLVERENDRRASKAKAEGGGYTVSAVPADRLIAAVYALENYDAGLGPIVMIPDGDGTIRYRWLNIGVMGFDLAGGGHDE